MHYSVDTGRACLGIQSLDFILRGLREEYFNKRREYESKTG